MTDDERIERLTSVLAGTGAIINDAYRIWALDTNLADRHVQELEGWADLRFLMAGSTLISDASIQIICSFRNLTNLCISNTEVTGECIASSDLPTSLKSLGLAGISLDNRAVASVCRCVELNVVNVNHCKLTKESLFVLAALPNLRGLEAIGADSTAESSRMLSEKYPGVLLRLRDGLWEAGQCLRKPFPSETL